MAEVLSHAVEGGAEEGDFVTGADDGDGGFEVAGGKALGGAGEAVEGAGDGGSDGEGGEEEEGESGDGDEGG